MSDINEDTQLPVLEEKAPLISEKVKIFDTLLKVLEKKGIKCKIIISPLYFKYKRGETYRICKLMEKKHANTEFWDYTNNVKFKDYRLFSDKMHLNDRGASVFSAMVASKLCKEKRR